MRAVTAARLRRDRLRRSLRRSAIWLLPLLLPIAVYGAIVFTGLPAGARARAYAGDRLIGGTAALGLVVSDIRVDGRITTSRATVLAALGFTPGTPILAVDLDRARDKLEALPWVRAAVIERRLPDTIYVRLSERQPLALWQHDDRLRLIDRDGGVIAVTDLAPFAHLPIVAGDGAPPRAAKLFDMLAAEPGLARRVTAAILVGQRRWNVQVDGAIEVMLPEDGTAAAWARLALLEHSDAILKRNIETVDMRLPDRLVVTEIPAPTPVKNGHPAKTHLTKKGRPAAKNT